MTFVTLLTALGCALIGGAFFAFSSFVMKALAALAPPQGIAAMQSINVVVINPWFLLPFMGTAALCGFLIVMSLLQWQDPRAAYWLAGAALYLFGTFGVTMAFNVPRNNALAAVDAASIDGAKVWAVYLSEWTAWNTVRTIAGIAAAAALCIALALRP
jgi:uncharacterized membrane protein